MAKHAISSGPYVKPLAMGAVEPPGTVGVATARRGEGAGFDLSSPFLSAAGVSLLVASGAPSSADFSSPSVDAASPSAGAVATTGTLVGAFAFAMAIWATSAQPP